MCAVMMLVNSLTQILPSLMHREKNLFFFSIHFFCCLIEETLFSLKMNCAKKTFFRYWNEGRFGDFFIVFFEIFWKTVGKPKNFYTKAMIFSGVWYKVSSYTLKWFRFILNLEVFNLSSLQFLKILKEWTKTFCTWLIVLSNVCYEI